MKYADTTHWLLTFLMNSGSLEFFFGSICYLPQLAYFKEGAILFIIGSAFFFSCDVIICLHTPELGPLKVFQNAGSFRYTITIIANLLFIIGSVCFIPSISPTTGSFLFIAGCAILFIAQIVTVHGFYSKNQYFMDAFNKIRKLKVQVFKICIFLSLGCLLFIQGLIIFFSPLFQLEAAVCFIVGSFFFLLAAIQDARMRHLGSRDRNTLIQLELLHA